MQWNSEGVSQRQSSMVGWARKLIVAVLFLMNKREWLGSQKGEGRSLEIRACRRVLNKKERSEFFKICR